jgi:hypothetical protein
MDEANKAQEHADLIEAQALEWALEMIDTADGRSTIEARVAKLRARSPQVSR